MNEVSLGFIGCGPRARGLMGNGRLIPGLKIAALCDKYEAMLSQGAAQLGNNRSQLYTDHRRMLREAPIDAVYIVVEPENCADLVIEALEAGKHVISEVPMAYSIEDVWRIVLTVEKTGLTYLLGEQARYKPHAQQWKKLADQGELGEILYVEGEYLHGMKDDRFYLDPETGERLTVAEAQNHPNPLKSRMWKLTHPILYLPHELSPLLNILDDRVATVTCMSSGTPSRARPFFPYPDFEAALMQTGKGALLNLRCGFTTHTIGNNYMGFHWHRIIGTKGTVETNRSGADKMKWLRDVSGDGQPEQVWWEFDQETIPKEAMDSGHGGTDYYPIRNFVDCLLTSTKPEFDVYRAAETAAPAILAAQSAESNSARLEVPDFRPNASRKIGEPPARIAGLTQP
jgi:predicted dehydrogenase